MDMADVGETTSIMMTLLSHQTLHYGTHEGYGYGLQSLCNKWFSIWGDSHQVFCSGATCRRRGNLIVSNLLLWQINNPRSVASNAAFFISEFCEPKLLQHTITKMTQELEIFIRNRNVCVFNTMLRSFETCFEMGALRNTQRMRGVVGKSCREGEWSPTEEDLIGSSVAWLFDTQLVFFVGKIKIAHGQEKNCFSLNGKREKTTQC